MFDEYCLPMQMAGAGKVDEPPGKKRKLDEENNENDAAAGFWDEDDDLLLTQDQWQNIDNNVDQYLSQHPQNSNVPAASRASNSLGKSPRTLGRGMPKSHSAGSYGLASPNTSNGAAQTPPGMGRAGVQSNRLVGNLKPLSSQRTHGIPSSNRALTPQAGSATVSPALPSQARCSVPENTQRLKKELEHFKQEIQSYKSSQYSKDGQITMLKKKLMEKERKLNELHQDKIHQIETQSREKTEKEKGLEAELEKLQTQMQFKEHEIAELQNACKRLEVKASSSGSDAGGSPRKTAPISPRRSPRVSSPRGTQQQSPFPNKKTFMEENKSTERPKRIKLFENSPLPEKGATKEIRENSCKLEVPNQKGAITGGSLVGKLISQRTVTGATRSNAGLMTLMASSIEHQTESSVSSVVPKKVATSSSQSEDTNEVSVKLKDSILIHQGVNSLLTLDYECSHTVLLLPAIEDQISSFLELCHKSARARAGLSVVAGSPCNENLEQKPENELVTKNVDSVYNSLSLLLKLSTWCGHCRDACLNVMMAGNDGCSLLDSQGSQSCAQASENQESESSDLQSIPASESLNVQSIVRKNKILDLLIQLARPNLLNGATRKMEILHLSLEIIVQIARHVSEESVERFSKLFTEDVLQQCLSPDVRENDEERVLLYISVLDILCPLMKYPKALDRMCAKKGDCLFNAVYTAAGHSLLVEGPNRTVLTRKILQFIHSILCRHDNGNQVLLESECQCSHQVARCVVTILHVEMLNFQKSKRHEQMMTLRQGISCLQSLSMVDRRGAVGVNDDAEIAQLVYSMERLMKDDKSVCELERAALQDLWDFFGVDQSEEQEMSIS